MQSNANDLTAFRDFVVKQVEANPTGVTPEDLWRQWRQDAEYNAVAEDLRQGLSDIEAGKGKPFREVLQQIRDQLGLPS